MRRTRAWRLLLTVSAGTVLLAGPALASRASKLDKLGQKAEKSGDRAQAFVYYSQAMAADPNKASYRQHAESVAQEIAMQGGSVGKAPEPASAAAPGPVSTAPAVAATNDATDEHHEIDLSPEAVFDSITARELAAQRELLPPTQLAFTGSNQNYDLEGDAKSLFDQVAARLGMKAVYDSDYKPARRFRFRLDGVSGREALHGLEAVTNSFVTPLSSKLFIVAEDTEPKRKELEQQETISVPIPSALTVQEITELGSAIKQAVGVERIYWDPLVNEIVLRDRVSRALAAQAVLQDLIAYRSQVAIDLEFIELDETEMNEIGVDLQTSFPLDFIGQLVNGNLTTTLTLAQLAHFSFTKMFGLGLVNMDVIAQLTKAGARNLLRTTMVSVSNQKATFHAGSKYPIITSQFVGGVSTGGQVYSPPPSFTFEDLGIVVTVTPHVHGMGEVSLDLDTEYKILGAASVNGIPIVSSRKMTSTIRLKSDQWAIVAGLTSDSKSRSVAGPAFFSNIPLLGHVISHFTGSKAKTYVIISMKPHVMSVPPEEKITHQVYVGSETRPLTPL